MHSKDAKEFLLCLIQKDVNLRYTADQAMNHPWIVNNAVHSEQTPSPQAFNDMQGTINMMKERKAVLIYLSQRMNNANFT